MDSIGSVFGKLGGLIKGHPSQALGAGLGIPAIISQYQSAKQQNQYIQSMLNLMKQYQSMTPGDVSAGVAALEKPLDQSLINSVTNPTQAFLAERGLTQAPGIAQQELSTNLAPFANQNIQNAINEFFQMKGLPIQAGSAGSYAFAPRQPQSLQGILSMLMGPQKAQSVGSTPPFIQGPATTGAFPTTGTYNFPGLTPPDQTMGDVGLPSDISGIVGVSA